jgi:hypothetical protein
MSKSAKRATVRKFPLEIRSIRAQLKIRIRQAQASVKAGESAVLRAQKVGDKARVKRNRASLSDAKNALANLSKALEFTHAACCHERENCDPIFD